MHNDARDEAGHVVVLTTVGSEADARALVRGLVDDRLVACGTLIPAATSIYRWEGAVTEEREVVVLLKTRRDRWADLQNAVSDRHPYDVPELLALPVSRGTTAYLDWVSDEIMERGKDNK